MDSAKQLTGYSKQQGMEALKTVFITGGAGYVGSVLVPKLLKKSYHVRVLDLFLYGEHVFDDVKGHPGLEFIQGDIRDRALLERIIPGSDAVIHLACISNDPSFELNPQLGVGSRGRKDRHRSSGHPPELLHLGSFRRIPTTHEAREALQRLEGHLEVMPPGDVP